MRTIAKASVAFAALLLLTATGHALGAESAAATVTISVRVVSSLRIAVPDQGASPGCESPSALVSWIPEWSWRRDGDVVPPVASNADCTSVQGVPAAKAGAPAFPGEVLMTFVRF